MKELRFEVPGLPQPAGSKRAFPFRRFDGSLGVKVSDDNPKASSWKGSVADAARRAMPEGAELLSEPLVLRVVFLLPRPAGHFRSGALAHQVRAGAPLVPTVRPDLLKLTRGLEDAMTGVVYRDDSQIVEEVLKKRYTTGPTLTQVSLTVYVPEVAAVGALPGARIAGASIHQEGSLFGSVEG